MASDDQEDFEKSLERLSGFAESFDGLDEFRENALRLNVFEEMLRMIERILTKASDDRACFKKRFQTIE